MTLYHTLKIVHIISASTLMASVFYCLHQWKYTQSIRAPFRLSLSIQWQTWGIIFPCAFFQLISGFTLISLNQADMTQGWIKGSIIGFMIVIVTWFSFVYCLLHQQRYLNTRHIQKSLVILCIITLFTMIFLMVNKS